MKTYTVKELLDNLPSAPLSPEKVPKNDDEKAALWARGKTYFATRSLLIVEENESLDRLIDAGSRLQAQLKRTEADAAVDAALEKFAAQVPADSFGTEQLAEVEAEIQTRLSLSKLDTANGILSKQQKRRRLTYPDLAFIFCAHRKNVLKNPSGASPYSGLVALGASAVEQEIIDSGYDHRQIAMSLTLLGAIGLTRCIEEPDKSQGRCGRWEILWHPKSAKEKPS